MNINQKLSQEIVRMHGERVAASKDLQGYLSSIRAEIDCLNVIINSFDKIYVLSGVAARHIESIEASEFVIFEPQSEGGIQSSLEKDSEIEILLEYWLSLALTSSNHSTSIPTRSDIDNIIEKLSTIKLKVTTYKSLEGYSKDESDESNWLQRRTFEEALHIRGLAFPQHWYEVYLELFSPHSTTIELNFKFGVVDIYQTMKLVKELVYSKQAGPNGEFQARKRLRRWINKLTIDGTPVDLAQCLSIFPVMDLFLKNNPDLADSSFSNIIVGLGSVPYRINSKLFWIIPESEIQANIFEALSCTFGDNASFTNGPFGGFPLNDSIVTTKPIVKYNGKYYCFNLLLFERNLYLITKYLLKESLPKYFEEEFMRNKNPNSRDNYLESKVESLFRSLGSSLSIHRSVKYAFAENGLPNKPELDLLVTCRDISLLIEVKAGELMSQHRRSDAKGLRDRITDLIAKSSSQSARAQRYIGKEPIPRFLTKSGSHVTVDKSSIIYRISVTLEALPTVYTNQAMLIQSGILDKSIGCVWIVSLFDLMIVIDILDNVDVFLLYLRARFRLINQGDIQFNDELDILEYFIDGKLTTMLLDPQHEVITHGTDKVYNYFMQSA